MKMGETQYLYRDEELNALLMMLKVRLPHYEPDENCSAEDGFRMMLASGLCEERGKEIILDRITAFLIKTMGETQRYCVAVGKDAYLGLFCGKYASVVLYERMQVRIAEPFRTEKEAADAFAAQLKRSRRKLILYVGTEDEPEQTVGATEWRTTLRINE